MHPLRSGLLLLSLLAVCALSAQVSSSPYRHLATAQNLVVFDTVAGQNLGINLTNPLAQHGNISINTISSGGSGNPYVYRVGYTPDPGFVGVDTFVLEYNYQGNYPYLVYRAFRVSVYPSIVRTQQDFAVTAASASVTLDVLANDTGSNGPLTVTSVPSSAHGTAAIVGNQVVFTPDAGYDGAAHFDYTVCDALGTCQTGSASIGVHSTAAPVNDSLQVFTARNTNLSIPLTFDGYTLFQAPTNGSVMLTGGQTFRYTPNFNFTGSDVFVLTNAAYGNTVFKTVKVAVLNTPVQNTMAMEDYVYTPKGQPITFNVRSNDIGNLMVKGWTIPNTLPGTVSGTSSNGNVTFTPNANFTGVATFYYKLGNLFVPDLEIGTVNVIVGNLPPSASTFDLTTPKATPLVINYRIPFIGFDFAVVDAPDHGTCSYFPGFSTQTYNGQTVSGNNLLVYTPAQNYVGLDEFEIRYCVPSNGNCQDVKIVVNVTDVFSTQAPYCVGDGCVWAGDANGDGVVNNKDLLPIGYFMGVEGDLRPDASLEWYGQYAANWANPFTGTSLDLKHVDTDGSGQVTSEDTLALSYFYGQQHRVTPNIPPVSKGLPFFLNYLTPPNPTVGDLVSVEVSLGNEQYPVTDVYGFTFDVRLSPQIVDSAFRMDYYDNSWLNLNAPFLELSRRPTVGKLETAFTRSRGVSASGYGVIGRFDFIIIDVVDGARPSDSNAPAAYTLEINSTLLNGSGATTEGTALIPMPLGVRPRSSDSPAHVSTADLLVYPSPAQDHVQVHLNGNDLIEQLTVTDLAGRVLWQSTTLSVERTQVDVATFPTGTYLMQARTASGQVTKKFQILR